MTNLLSDPCRACGHVVSRTAACCSTCGELYPIKCSVDGCSGGVCYAKSRHYVTEIGNNDYQISTFINDGAFGFIDGKPVCFMHAIARCYSCEKLFNANVCIGKVTAYTIRPSDGWPDSYFATSHNFCPQCASGWTEPSDPTIRNSNSSASGCGSACLLAIVIALAMIAGLIALI